ncbi:ABC transporter ATP-binding protein/permease [Chamaesiphon sp.]|uniref:ABC transporter ATP-binding protein/permease n=1 Tax=Chamaesiphon sp. TaxID=2814140 RepID=UPI0035942D87
MISTTLPLSNPSKNPNLPHNSLTGSIRLEARDITLGSKDKKRLDNITFTIEPGQLIAIVGGSGAGKSTLMRVLLGNEAPTSGTIHLNGVELRENYDLFRQQIGYVPQDDIVHSDLTVEESLCCAAKLRLPAGTKIREVVERTLDRIQMTDRRRARIANLSGGQRKRVSIGVELLADPKLFLLDEPTSGLDPGLDRSMMELLRDVAHKDRRTVAVVTHATDNISVCDRVLFLGRGGRLCFYGTPRETLIFFGCGNFTEAYLKLEAEAKIELYQAIYRGSGYYRDYVANRLRTPSTGIPSFTVPRSDLARQWRICCHRQLKLTRRDRVNLLLSLLVAPVGIGLLKVAISDVKPFTAVTGTHATSAIQVLLVFVCACLWVGLSGSLQEIVKEKAIYARERAVNLKIRAYLGAKVFVLGLLAIVQAGFIAYAIAHLFIAPSNPLMTWESGMALASLLTLVASLSLGLLVSAVVSNGSQANSLLPLLLIPQIVFSGALFKLEGIANTISYFTISRWSIGAFGTIANVNALAPNVTDLPFPFGVAYSRSWNNLACSLSMLIVHAGIYILISAWLLSKKDIIK